MEQHRRIVKRGTWLYDDSVPCAVTVVEQNWDKYHEEWDAEPPHLNEAGLAYYVDYQLSTTQSFALGSHTCFSVEEAVELAEATVQGEIIWDD